MRVEDREQDWFKALTFEAFKKYDFEWEHRHSQEENIEMFLLAVESYGYARGRDDTIEDYEDD